MQAAAFALIVNVFVAGLFAASFGILATAYPTQRRALWFSASYAVGLLTPLSEFLLPLTGWTTVFTLASYASFAAAILSMAAALAAFHRRPIPWRAIAALFVAAVAMRTLIWGGPRDTLAYELAYQVPFAAAAALCAAVQLAAVRLVTGRRRGLEIALVVLFGLLLLHFLAKPFLAVAFGSGRSAAEYTASTYALLSQATTGILLVATGLLVLLIVFQAAIGDSQRASETDVLSGLANRRGFDERAARALEAGHRQARPAAIVLFDLDHFKALNDTHGHASGDEVIRAFADLLQGHTPDGSVVGRIGGEEFAVLLDGADSAQAMRLAEAVRRAAAARPGPPPFTVSAGVAAVAPQERLREAIRRADGALYRAKRDGRNRVSVAVDTTGV